MADIKSFFYCVKIPEYNRDFLRFYWWPDGDYTKEPREYRMCVHLFGATSSPSCANTALHKAAEDNRHEFDLEVINTIYRNFYVDDCLRSVDSPDKAVKLIEDLTRICKLGGFHLTKWISNCRSVIETVPLEEQAKEIKNLDLDYDSLPVEHALGVKCTLCQQKLSWDEEIGPDLLKRWNKWLVTLPRLESLIVPRCFKPAQFGDIEEFEIHHFSDASDQGYGVVSYIRLVNKEGEIHCSLVLGKARVAPLQKKTIPKMELTTATIAVKLHKMISQVLDYNWTNVYYWTDSQTVLKYIANEKSRFHTYQWNYIDTKTNPVDDCSRGIMVENSSFHRWVTGPEFLWKPISEWPSTNIDMTLLPDDPEVKIAVNLATVKAESSIKLLISKISSWKKLKRIIGWILYYLDILKKRVQLSKIKNLKPIELRKKTEIETMVLDNEYYLEAERCILHEVQKEYFSAELEILETIETEEKKLKKSSRLIKLDPLLTNGLIRVGGRLNRSNLSEDAKHPVILPKESTVSKLIIEETHRKMGHLGKNSIVAELRQKYWILKVNAAVKSIISKCVTCKKYQAAVGQQKMADLPAERFAVDKPPFTNIGIDYFGPIEIKRGRNSKVKCYGVLFTCMTIRAMHLEVAYSLSTDSCINAIRRFLARRGSVQTIWTDNGSNFIGAAKEVSNIKWKFNPPTGSHFGGIWERQIRTVRKILYSLLKEQVINLNEENLNTLFCEVECIVNSRPITRNSDDPNDLEAITPNHLINIQGEGILPPGVFEKTDNYTSRRWRQVQYLANVFWSRWIREYLPTLQERQNGCPQIEMHKSEI